ncbi:MAG TPA: HAMP domain-containing sensor histidine kinase [Candidatus Saccharimonadales bacterium]|nr:HAMP domain-containing sensor histidine kinase [Candidatus Saccharimonadales bacterium]
MKGRNTHEQSIAALAAAAHELKSPLTLVHHIAQTLASTDLALSEAERAQYLHRLQFTSERMLRLVQQLAVSYRLDRDNQLAFQFQVEPLNVMEVCEEVAHELWTYAKECSQELRVKTHNCPHLVVANREILHDIVVNLVDNAIRHNQAGGKVDIAAVCRSDQVRLTVDDQGAGMAQRDIRRLRSTLGTQPQPFTGHAGTSGLGLYIVGQFAAAMGGSVGLGRPRSGTRFFVDLLRSRQLSLL